MQLREDQLEDARGVLEHLIVPEAEHSKVFPAKIRISLPVGRVVAMVTAVSFDDQRSFETGEVNDVRSDDMLPSEFYVGHSAIPEHGPQTALGRRGIGSHFASTVAEFTGALALVA